MSSFWRKFFPWPFIVIGAVALYFGLGNTWQAYRSSHWPEADGRIVTSKVESHRGNKSKIICRAAIVYEYKVEGRSYSARRVAYGDYGTSDTSHARSVVARYPVGRSLPVHYQAADPESAVLEPGIQLQTLAIPVVGLVFLGAGLIARRVISRQSAAPSVPPPAAI